MKKYFRILKPQMNADSRVKQRLSNLHLLIKLHGLISSMQLSFGISLCKKWFHPKIPRYREM
ncbi:MAG: hypothetical protein OIN84_18235, partial [Candidatus Methanoperedens sp.]|nr:hypothetical protein [Candidatus Methanoperedens sp.]